MLLVGKGSQTSECTSSPKDVNGGASLSALMGFLVVLVKSQESQVNEVPSLIRSIPSMELCQMREHRTSMLMWPRQWWSTGSVTHSCVTAAEAAMGCTTLYSPLAFVWIALTVFPCIFLMVQVSFSKETEFPSLVMYDIDTIVMAISGACKMSCRIIGVEDFP